MTNTAPQADTAKTAPSQDFINIDGNFYIIQEIVEAYHAELQRLTREGLSSEQLYKLQDDLTRMLSNNHSLLDNVCNTLYRKFRNDYVYTTDESGERTDTETISNYVWRLIQPRISEQITQSVSNLINNQFLEIVQGSDFIKQQLEYAVARYVERCGSLNTVSLAIEAHTSSVMRDFAMRNRDELLRLLQAQPENTPESNYQEQPF